MTKATEFLTAQVAGQFLGAVIVRTARKSWTCTTTRDGRNPRHPDCTTAIKPGDLHIEYVGNAAACESGTRYCIPCGLLSFGDETDGAGSVFGLVCGACGDEHHVTLGEVVLVCHTCGSPDLRAAA